MKQVYLILIFLQSSLISAQTESRISNILKIPRTQVEKIEPTTVNTLIYLPCTFALSDFEGKYAMLNSSSVTVLKVYYVYTRFRLSPGFDQHSLDQQRFLWLNKHFPGIVNDPLVEWEIIEQTGCKTPEEGSAYFHGFILVIRPESGDPFYKAELDLLFAFANNPLGEFHEINYDPIKDQITGIKPEEKNSGSASVQNSKAEFIGGDNKLYEHFQQNLKNSPEISPQRLDKWISVSFVVLENGKTDSLLFLENYPDAAWDQVENAFKNMPDWKPATENGKPVNSTVNMEIRISYSGDVKGMYTRDGQRPNFENTTVSKPVDTKGTDINLLTKPEPISLKSSAVYKGIEMMRYAQKTGIVMDVTGSMSTHVAAMLNWLATHSVDAPFTSYTFFNDGNNKSEKQKKLGETGGIYATSNRLEVNELIKEAMMKGNGGEAPENDMEAVLYAFANDPSADEMILIGDNFSEVRDIELLKQVSKPVHVLLCAAPKFIRCEYLKIAKDTGGKLILNGDLVDLSGIQKGDVFLIQKVQYKYNGSQFEIEEKGEIHY